MAGYIDQVLPEQTQSATYQEIRTEHQANGVPVTSWRSLVNVGLSLTQYVSEAITTARNIVRTVLRGLFVDSLQEDLTAATPEQYAQMTRLWRLRSRSIRKLSSQRRPRCYVSS
jgi:hypothetical protein